MNIRPKAPFMTFTILWLFGFKNYPKRLLALIKYGDCSIAEEKNACVSQESFRLSDQTLDRMRFIYKTLHVFREFSGVFGGHWNTFGALPPCDISHVNLKSRGKVQIT